MIGGDKPIEKFNGTCIAVIHRTDDEDDKLVVSNNKNITDKKIKTLTHFQEKYFKSVIIS